MNDRYTLLGDAGRTRLADYLQALSLANVLFPLMITVLATLGFVLGLPLSPGVVALAAAAAFLTLRPFTPSWGAAAVAAVITVIVHVGAYLLANAFFDNSWDGLAYHQVGVLRLASGWNPLFEYANDIWVDHYPKASWLLSGDHIEAGKLFNFTLMLAAGAQVAATLFRLTTLRLPAVILISVLTMLNPVAVYQSTTFCVDGALASLLTVMVAGLILYAATPTWSALAASLFAACLLSNFKFTGLIYVAIFLFATVLVVFQRHGLRAGWQFTLAAAIAGIVSFSGLGYAPYIRNLVEKGHPLYPVMGPQRVDVVTANRPANLNEKDRFSRFLIANFSRSEYVRAPRATTLKFPLWLEPRERYAWSVHGPEAGGLGPFYGALLLMAGAGVYLLLHNAATRHYLLPVCLIGGCLLVSIFVHGEGWWARYAPQAWLIPLLVTVCLLSTERPAYLWLGRLMLALTLANVLFVGYYHLRHEQIHTKRVQESLSEISSARQPVTVYLGPFPSLKERLRERRIDFKVIELPPAANEKAEWHEFPSPAGDALCWITSRSLNCLFVDPCSRKQALWNRVGDQVVISTGI
jgi:hypothetical protein